MVERKFRLGMSLVLVACLFSSCLTEVKVNRWLKDHPDKFSYICAEEFPIKTEVIKGEETIKTEVVYQKGDSIPCPEDKNGKIKLIKCPPNKTITNTIYRTDTLKIENTATIKTLKTFIKKNEDLYQQEQNKRLESEEKAKKRTSQRNSLAIILLGSLAWNFRNILLKFM